MLAKDKLNVAVIFGGASPEHDVSVISAQQLMDAIDYRRITVIPIYMDFENRFCTGSCLRDICHFKPRPYATSAVGFEWSERGPGMRVGSGEFIRIDCVLPVLHGLFGEDGRVQSFFELLGFPIAGLSASSSAISMRKDSAKSLVKLAGVNTLDHIAINSTQWKKSTDILSLIDRKLKYPVVVKPANLGSSIGLGVAHNPDEVYSLLEYVFKWDIIALVEPKVAHLAEFNIAVMMRNHEIAFSAIERPRSNAELLDFKNKYLSSAGKMKSSPVPSDGMLSLSRELNPPIPDSLKERIYDFAAKSFLALGGKGCPRIDFLYDQKADSLFFNEINPIPGSYAFFLWEKAEKPLLFPDLINHLIDEALCGCLKKFDDPVPQNATLLPR